MRLDEILGSDEPVKVAREEFSHPSMKTAELFETSLTEFTEILALRKHGKLSKEDAEKLASELKSFTFHVGGKNVPANLRWKEDKLTNTLKFVTADMPGTWRSGPSAVSRGAVIKLLREYGFSVARFQSDAARRENNIYNGPHIFFWGKGTPPQDLTKLSKIAGTGEWRKQIEDAVKAQRVKDEGK